MRRPRRRILPLTLGALFCGELGAQNPLGYASSDSGSDPDFRLPDVADVDARAPPPARAARRDADLDLPAQPSEEVHQALDGKTVEAVAHEVGDMRLADAEQLRRGLLPERTAVEDAIHFHGELDL